ncbi:MAG: alpha/beta fold hydrolase [Nitrospiraceae bacterium]|nr:alpha/beta fold hydrolase [Nitrospiraceae bacterium]
MRRPTAGRCVLMGTMLAGIALFQAALAADDLGTRRENLEQLRRVLPQSEEWESWLDESGELPPDFDAMPSVSALPDPLEGGSTKADWPQRREQLKAEFHQWILGSVPPRPDNLEAVVLSEESQTGVLVREVELRFGAGRKGRLWLVCYIPQGEGPFPVFLTQENHNGWARVALQRGYLCCVYAGSDSRDDTDSFLKAYPEHDWSRLTRRAWAAGRCIDYLETLPEADTARVALTGHSRNGKLSLIASAIDERVGVVISSSSGAGGCLPTRFYSEQHFGEGIENITRVFPDWFHPRWRFFVGREDRLPIDLHELVALSAPRPCLLSIAYNDGVESAWAMEKTYLSAKRVYKFLGAEDSLRILWRAGGHETSAAVIERYMDWCDVQFGRGDFAFPERLLYPHDWEAWRQASGVTINPAASPERGLDDTAALDSQAAWTAMKGEVRGAVEAMLGVAPPKVVNPGGRYGEQPDHIEDLLRHPKTGKTLKKDDIVFGEYINGDLYSPRRAGKSGQRLPAVLWLHPMNSSHGYVAAYRRGENAFSRFARAGFAVFCYDQIGCGRRVQEAETFYERYPQWSLMGKMVRDAQSALDAMVGLDSVDPDRIYVVGYGMGAMVGQHLCALDDRPAGLIAVCGPPPFRLDTGDATGGGITRWSHRHLYLPRLGFYAGNENRVPYDIHLLAGCMAPRPVAFVTPTLDREAPLPLMKQAVDAVKPVYALWGAEDQVEQLAPEDYNRFGPEMQAVVLDWLRKHASSERSIR